MWLDKKIALVVDTNVFTHGSKKPHDFSELDLDDYYKLIKTINSSNISDNVTILFPEIVLLELISHYRLKLIKKVNETKLLINNFKGLVDINISSLENLDIEEHCDFLIDNYYKNLNIIEIPKDRVKLFNQILNMSFKKIPPFEKDKSDKGFKDSILFLSLINFVKNNPYLYDQYVLFSDDKIFKNKKQEFINFFNHEIYGNYEGIENNKLIIWDNINITNYFTQEFKLFKDLISFLNDIFLDELIDKYESICYIEVNFNFYESEFIELIYDDTHIFELEPNIFEVEFYSTFGYYCDNFDYKNEYKYINQSEGYIFKKVNNKWEYILDYRLYDVEFNTDS